MLSNEIVYEKATIFSPRLGKDIEVETYAGDNGSIVISAISLRDAAKKACESLKTSIGTTLVQMFPNENGEVGYCLVKTTLRIQNNENEEIIQGYGEFCASGAKNEIALTNPFAVAQNRAESKCFIKFLGLSGRVYSSDEMDSVNRSNFQQILEQAGKNAKNENQQNGFVAAKVESSIAAPEKVGEAEKKEITNTVNETTEKTGKVEKTENPVKNVADNTNTDKKKATDTDTKTKNEENIQPAKTEITDPNVEEIKSDDEDDTEKSADKMPVSDEASSMADKAGESSANETSETKTTDNGLNLIVTFGPAKGKNLTVKDVLADPIYAKFVENIKSGRAVAPYNNEERLAIFEAIKNN